MLEFELRLERERLKDAREYNTFLAAINASFVDQARSAMLLLDTAGKRNGAVVHRRAA